MADEIEEKEINDVIKEDEIVSTKPEHRGSLGAFLDRLEEDAQKGGVKIIKSEDVPPKENEDIEGGNGEATEYDYSIFKNIDDDDYKKIDEYLKENKIDNPAIRHKLASDIDDIKKQQRLASERAAQIEELKKAGKVEVETDKKFTDTIDGLKSDFFGTYDRLAKEYQLPDLTSLSKMIASGNTLQARIAQYQKDVLAPQIEKEFNLEDGTFVFDPGEAWQSGTPSYEYRVRTADKESELRQEYGNKQQMMQKAAKEMIDLRNKQILELKDYYFSVDEKDEKSDEYQQEAKSKDEAYQELLGKLDNVYDKMKKGEVIPAEENPFAFKNVFRGVFYDNLMKIEIERAAKKIHEQYAKHGLYLPENEMPEDITKVKGKPPDGESDKFKVGDTKFSPQNRFLKRVESEVKSR